MNTFHFGRGHLLGTSLKRDRSVLNLNSDLNEDFQSDHIEDNFIEQMEQMEDNSINLMEDELPFAIPVVEIAETFQTEDFNHCPFNNYLFGAKLIQGASTTVKYNLICLVCFKIISNLGN